MQLVSTARLKRTMDHIDYNHRYFHERLRAELQRAGLEPVRGLIERTTCVLDFGGVAGTSLCALTKFITEEVIWRIFCTILGRRPLVCSCAQAVLSVPWAEGPCRASPAGTSQYWA